MEGPQVPVVTEKPLCLGRRKQKAKRSEKCLHLEYVVLSSYISAASFFFAVMLIVQRLITRADECPDLLVAKLRDSLRGAD